MLYRIHPHSSTQQLMPVALRCLATQTESQFQPGQQLLQTLVGETAQAHLTEEERKVRRGQIICSRLVKEGWYRRVPVQISLIHRTEL